MSIDFSELDFRHIDFIDVHISSDFKNVIKILKSTGVFYDVRIYNSEIFTPQIFEFHKGNLTITKMDVHNIKGKATWVIFAENCLITMDNGKIYDNTNVYGLKIQEGSINISDSLYKGLGSTVYNGGAIYFDDTNLEVKNVTFIGNRGIQGAAIYHNSETGA
jgi:hypothetical protein